MKKNGKYPKEINQIFDSCKEDYNQCNNNKTNKFNFYKYKY